MNKNSGWDFALLMVAGTILGALILLATGCSDSVTGPSNIPEPVSQTPTATTPSVQAPQPVAETPGQQKGTIDGACFEVKNNLDIAVRYYARIYEIVGAGEQQFRQELVSGSVPPGESWSGCFDALPCNYQIDLDGDYPVNTPAPGLLGSKIVTGNICEPVCKEGTLLSDITDEKFGKCNKVSESNGESCSYDECKYRIRTYETCTKEKRISIEEVARQTVQLPGTWITQEPVREKESDWGKCEEKVKQSFSALTNQPPPQYDECKGMQSRTYDEVVYEVNSCTKEKREKSRTQKTEEQPCEYQCLARICHTENKQYCGEKLNKNTSEWEYVCQNQYWNNTTKPDPVKKWQCQNVPPGVPGHYDNHFNKIGHDDFFGECGPVGGTSEQCYSITN